MEFPSQDKLTGIENFTKVGIYNKYKGKMNS